jgi:hypothetical protein
MMWSNEPVVGSAGRDTGSVVVACLHAPEMRRTSLQRVYISAATEGYPGRSTFKPIEERARAGGCQIIPVESGHDVMIEAPTPLAEAILEATL